MGVRACGAALVLSGLPSLAAGPTTETVAVSESAPIAVPSVQLPTRATPEASVIGDAPASDPPPAVTAKSTWTLATGLLSTSLTTTEGAIATAVPTAAL